MHGLAHVLVPTPLSPRRRLVRALRAWDRQVFREIAARRSPASVVVLPALSRLSDHSLLWIGVGGRSMATRRRAAHRAARRRLFSLAAASLLTDRAAKHTARQTAQPSLLVRLACFAVRDPASTGYRFGHAASAIAFAGAVGVAEAALMLPLGGLAAAMAYSRSTPAGPPE